MERCDIDVAPHQIVAWLKTELRSGRRALDIRATRDYVAAEAANLENAGIGLDTDLVPMMLIGTLEIRPRDDLQEWKLELRAEDPLGDHIPEDHSVAAIPEEIDLDAFDAAFVAPDRAIINARLYAETPEARERFDGVLADIIRDRHGD